MQWRKAALVVAIISIVKSSMPFTGTRLSRDKIYTVQHVNNRGMFGKSTLGQKQPNGNTLLHFGRSHWNATPVGQHMPTPEI